MKVSFLGGALEVGGSCILLKVDNKNLLLDCGIRQSSSKDPIPDFKIIQENGGVDAIIISHAHMDHIGCLPIISKEYPMARIYTNVMTKDLMRVLLYDSLKIMNNREAEIPLYAEKDVIAMLTRVFPINYMVEFPIFEDIKICFYMAGHIAGASCVYIKSPEGSVFYSGDFSVFSQKTVEGLKLPKLRPDIGIFETTYGDRLHSNREVEEQKLIEIIRDCIENKGKMLIPAFALGRAQEVILIMKKAINKGIIKNIKIYVDGMIRDINRVYKLNPLYLKNSLGKKILRGIEPFYDDNITAVKDKKVREDILESEESCIIISSSGMLTGGFSQYYAEKIAPMENSYIVITGYQDEESPGRKLLNLLDEDEKDKKIELNGRTIPVKCRVERVGLSAHSDKEEIKSVIKMLSPRNIFMVHGNEEVIKKFSREISYDVRARIYSPGCGESYSIYINNPRKQLNRNIYKCLFKKEELNKENLKELWKFVNINYNQRFFTVEELIYIWNGVWNGDKNSNYILDFEKNILNSIYFENNTKRLFLFKAKSSEEVEKELKPRELKPNELNDFINKYFGEFKFKKASLIYEEKKVILSFNFPSIVDNKIYDVIKNFKSDTKWNVEISDSVNINECSRIIKEIMNGADIKKISYRLDKNEVEVSLDSKTDVNDEIMKKFINSTGMKLFIKFSGNGINNDELTHIIESDNSNIMEQNKALDLIDDEFKYMDFKPYKKSIKSYANGKYIELSFITPVIGQKYEKNIEHISKKTGWNIKISDSVNQNEIINMAILLCNLENIKLKKNPSFNRNDLTLLLKLEKSEEITKMDNIKHKFEQNTGCSLIFKS
ncbi:putative metal-dependent RNase [Clostridium algifaecis]|uniref:Metal-dependent RNase n=1 Tax=Clostridium algifaecis TaxID=1472040 RepID=A0ABS4KR60_9CLOT|nr:MBL fold metallo-hydrolase [Clostridium algifaecis]MBP2032520.1 putative metal-dependent RNase [Clostridium algifaecis]